MIQEIKMPAAGQTTNKAVVCRICVKAGDNVKRGDVLLEAETDKAVLPVESFANGTVLAILVAEGDQVTAGTVLMAVGKPGEVYAPASGTAPAAPAPQEVPAQEQEEYLPIVRGEGANLPVPAAPAGAEDPDYPAMPNARRLARERGIDIRRVDAANGQFVTRRDVERHVPQAAAQEPEYEVLPMNRMRQIIGSRMRESLDTIPCWQCTSAIRMDACMDLRDTYREKKGIRLSYNDIMAKAIAEASRKFPLVRARYEENEVRIYKHTNVGLAVGLEGALVVPVVKEIDGKGLEEIAAAYKDVIQKARNNRLAPGEMGCGSITISNLGMYDVDHFIAIVNPPESCILAVGKIETQPVWDGAAFQPVPKMTITGSFDHRIIDGAYGAQFLRELKLLMENPALLLG